MPQIGGKQNAVDTHACQCIIPLMYETRGSLLVIHDMQSFPSGFTKREFVINSDEKYPQQLKFELVKDRCSMLDSFSVGDDVVVNFDLRGNEYNGRHFVSLSCWKLQLAENASASQSKPRAASTASSPVSQRASQTSSEPSPAELRNESDFDEEDEIPF